MAANGCTGLVVITHGEIGRALLDVAAFILDQPLVEVGFLSFCQSSVKETGDAEILRAIEHADSGQGVLVMTDICGASPYNHVARLVPSGHLALLSGLNLAMLIRAWNHRSMPPEQLVEMAAEGAVRDIQAGQLK